MDGDKQSRAGRVDGYSIHTNPDGSCCFVEGLTPRGICYLTTEESRKIDAAARRLGVAESFEMTPEDRARVTARIRALYRIDRIEHGGPTPEFIGWRGTSTQQHGAERLHAGARRAWNIRIGYRPN